MDKVAFLTPPRPGAPSAGLFGLLPRRQAGVATCAALLLAYAVLVAARLPYVWLNGRFWAEEGVIYFLNARSQPWYDALLAVHTGYINLAASLATLLAARLAPLVAAPWVSTSVALLIQLFPPLLLMTSGVLWLRDRWTLAVALLLLLIPHGGAEVWLNSITSQFHLTLCAALILALPTCGGWVGGFRLFLLVLAPLSGPASAFLVPLFVLRAWLDWSRGRAIQGVVLGTCAAVQVAMVLLHPEPGRDIGIGPRMLALIVTQKHVLVPLLGRGYTMQATGNLVEAVLGSKRIWPLMLPAVAMVGLLSAAARASRTAVVCWLFVAALVVLTMSYFGALGHHIDLLNIAFGDRYSYVPAALLGLTLLAIAQNSDGWARSCSALAVVWLLCVGLGDYWRVGDTFAHGSSWPAEVAHWRADPSYHVQFWPNFDSWRGPLGEAPPR